MGYGEIHDVDAKPWLKLDKPQSEHAFELSGIARRARCADRELAGIAINPLGAEHNGTSSSPRVRSNMITSSMRSPIT